MDFLLPEIEAVVEIKMMRPTLSTNQFGEQLMVDIAKYKAHPACRTLFCRRLHPPEMTMTPATPSDLTSTDGSG